MYYVYCILQINIDLTFDRTMALEVTQPLTEMTTRNISWREKAAGAYG